MVLATVDRARTVRDSIALAKRLVVKVGSSALTTSSGGVDIARVDMLIDAIAARRAAGTEIVLATSGAIAAGLAPLDMRTQPADPAGRRAAASVGQAQLMHSYVNSFGRHGIRTAQLLLTSEDLFPDRRFGTIDAVLDHLLESDVVPVINENDVSSLQGGRFDNNDMLAALLARQVDATALVLLSDVAGLYETDPLLRQARLLIDVDPDTMAAKVAAIRVATGAGIPVILTSALRSAEALSGAHSGTVFAPCRPGNPS